MIAWDILNSILRLGIAIIIVWKLYNYNTKFNRLERIGMGITGGCSILTISVIWDMQRSPFDGWATSLFSAGVFLYFVGRLSRYCPDHRIRGLL